MVVDGSPIPICVYVLFQESVWGVPLSKILKINRVPSVNEPDGAAIVNVVANAVKLYCEYEVVGVIEDVDVVV